MRNIMINVTDLKFDLNKHGITVVGTYGPTTVIKYDFENGDDVSLRKGEIKVEVKSVEKQADGTFKGVIKNIKPYNSLESEQISEGTEILFSYTNIFACTKN